MKSIRSSAGVIALSFLAWPALAEDKTALAEPDTILAVFAHPDDEIVAAPSLARSAREGHKVILVLATRGDQGGPEPGEALAARRTGEAECSAGALGIEDLRFLDLGDGTLNLGPQLPDSPASQMAGKLLPIIEAEQPDIVVTWGPEGGYGHGDHWAVSAVVTQVVQAIEHDRPKLLYPGVPSGTAFAFGPIPPFIETAPDLLTESHAYTQADLEKAMESARCHESQFSEEVRENLVRLWDERIWQGSIHFRVAFTSP